MTSSATGGTRMTSSEAAAADAASVLSSTDTSILASRGEVEARALSIELAAQLLDRAPKEWRRAACVVAYPMNREMPGLGPMLLRVLLEAAPNESTRHALVHGFVDSTASWESSMSAGGSAAMEQFHECAAVFTGLGLGRGLLAALTHRRIMTRAAINLLFAICPDEAPAWFKAHYAGNASGILASLSTDDSLEVVRLVLELASKRLASSESTATAVADCLQACVAAMSILPTVPTDDVADRRPGNKRRRLESGGGTVRSMANASSKAALQFLKALAGLQPTNTLPQSLVVWSSAIATIHVCVLKGECAELAVEALVSILQAARHGSDLADLYAVLVVTQQHEVLRDVRDVVCALLGGLEHDAVTVSNAQLLNCPAAIHVSSRIGAKLREAASSFGAWRHAELARTLLETPLSMCTNVIDCVAVALSDGGPLDGVDIHDWVVEGMRDTATDSTSHHPALRDLLDHYVNAVLPARDDLSRARSMPILPHEFREIMAAGAGDNEMVLTTSKIMALYLALRLEDRARNLSITLPFTYRDIVAEQPLRSLTDLLGSKSRSNLEDQVLQKLRLFFPTLLASSANSDEPDDGTAFVLAWANRHALNQLVSRVEALSPLTIRMIAASPTIPLCQKERVLWGCLPNMVNNDARGSHGGGGEAEDTGGDELAHATAELFFHVLAEARSPQRLLLATARSLLCRGESLVLQELVENPFVLLTLPTAALQRPGTLQIVLGVLDFFLAASEVSLETWTPTTAVPLAAPALVMVQEVIVARCLLGLCRDASKLRDVVCAWLQKRFRRLPDMAETMVMQGLRHDDVQVLLAGVPGVPWNSIVGKTSATGSDVSLQLEGVRVSSAVGHNPTPLLATLNSAMTLLIECTNESAASLREPFHSALEDVSKLVRNRPTPALQASLEKLTARLRTEGGEKFRGSRMSLT